LVDHESAEKNAHSVDWHRWDTRAVVEQLRSGPDGLSEAEATRRLEEHGPNEIIDRGRRSAWLIMWEQISSALVVMLLAAAGASIYLSAYSDALVIMAIVGLNAALGFFQDYRAEQALAALKRLAVPLVHVRRSGSACEISASDIVPGDILLLEAGNLVPADARLLDAQHQQDHAQVAVGVLLARSAIERARSRARP